MLKLRDILLRSPVMPVIVIDRLDDAVPLARALVAGGIDVLEVTLRTPAALEALRAMAAAVPEAVVGAGTVTRADQIAQCRAAGARFAVSPGLTPDLANAARIDGLALLPGVMTPSEVMVARDGGFTELKLFPAEPAGGVAMLKALSGPLPEVMFCPTGGINAGSAASYLALPNVACVGGSWLTPPELVRAGDWAAITALARKAASLR